jgi:hypothetical protein
MYIVYRLDTIKKSEKEEEKEHIKWIICHYKNADISVTKRPRTSTHGAFYRKANKKKKKCFHKSSAYY